MRVTSRHELARRPLAVALCLGLAVSACGGDSEALAPGLECIELAALVTYQEAVDYFEASGNPARLDPDGDGMPCEQDFSPREIEEVFGTTTSSSIAEGSTTTSTTLARPTTTAGGGEETTATTATPTTRGQTTTTVPAPVGLFASAVGGTQPRVCQRWEEELRGDDGELPDGPVFALLRDTPTIQVGRIAVFCLFDFDFDTPVLVEATHPGGNTVGFSILLDSFDPYDTSADPLAGEDLIHDGSEGAQWVVASSHQPGSYTFVATQGELVEAAVVEIVPATTARIDAFHENRGGFPDPLGFAFSGFPAGHSIQLGVYRDATDPFFGDDGAPTDHEFTLVATLQSVSADSRGAVIVYLNDGDFEYEDGQRHCLATTLDLIPQPVCDNFRGGWFVP